MKRESKLTQPMLFLATLLIFLFVAGEAAAFSLLDGKEVEFPIELAPLEPKLLTLKLP